jgi:protein O-mannosyl-transferase
VEESNRGAKSSGRGASPWLPLAAILLLTFAAYSPTLRYGFVHDDRGQIVENPAVHSWSALPQYFTAQVWAGVYPEELGNYFRPLFLTWLRLNDAVFGGAAWGWHLTTILAHLVVVLLVYFLVMRLAGDRGVALLATLIFALHPAHIEAVTWISGVTEPLLGMLLIGAFLCYLRVRETRWLSGWGAAALGLFALAILEKETAMILPGLLAAYEWIYGPEWGESFQAVRVWRWVVTCARRIWPFGVLMLLYLPARIHALKGFSHAVTPLATSTLLNTWPGLIAFWMRHLLWPVGLSTFYDMPAVVHPDFRNFVLPAILDVVVLLLLIFWAWRNRTVAFSVVWLVLPLLPVLNIRVFVADDFAHDRYLYLPSLGLAVLAACLLARLTRGHEAAWGLSRRALVAAGVLAAALSYGVLQEGAYFRDNLTFYAYNLQKAPLNRYAASNFATVLGEEGSYGPAVRIFTGLLERHPDFWPAAYNLGYTYYKLGQLVEAEKYLRRAIGINPLKSEEYLYLGLARFKQNDVPGGIANLQTAIRLRANGYAYHFALGMMLKTQGDLPDALREFQTELANYPTEAAAAAQVKDLQAKLGEETSKSKP